jgi:hypothetical protein
MRVVKLDRRYTGSDMFKYCVEFNWLESKKFVDVREWCWGLYGPSAEINYARQHYKDAKYAWMSDNGLRVYLKSAQEVEWFNLRWL